MRLQASALAAVIGMLLGIHNGYIALWRDGASDPAEVFPYRAAMLPEQDYQRLEKGIVIESESRLHRLLEDYLS